MYPVPPLELELDHLEVDLPDPDLVAGRGRFDFVPGRCPRFELRDGVYVGEPGDFVPPTAQIGVGPGVLFEVPDLRVRGRAGDVRVEGRPVTAKEQSLATEVTGTYVTKLATVSRPSDSPVARIDFIYLGRPANYFPLPRLDDPVGGLRFGQVVEHGEHRFIIGSKPPKEITDALWAPAGIFSYVGPLGLDDDALLPMVWRFALLLGNALGSPVDPLCFVEVRDDNTWSSVKWWRPWKPNSGGKAYHVPVGAEPVRGRGATYQAAANAAAWIQTGMKTSEAWAADGEHDFDLFLMYIEEAPSRSRSELRCRDLVIAIEGLAGAMCDRNNVPRSGKLGTTLRTLRKKVGISFTDSEIARLEAYRNRLSHRGDLRAARTFDLSETQEMFQSEGWLMTCCYRVLSAVLGLDVPIADFGDLNFTRRRPSEGGFQLPDHNPRGA